MKTLQEDIDDLDRMADTDASKDAIRAQIRLVAREVAALEADYTSLSESHAKLKAENEALKATQAQRDSNAWDKAARDADIPETYPDPLDDFR